MHQYNVMYICNKILSNSNCGQIISGISQNRLANQVISLGLIVSGFFPYPTSPVLWGNCDTMRPVSVAPTVHSPTTTQITFQTDRLMSAHSKETSWWQNSVGLMTISSVSSHASLNLTSLPDRKDNDVVVFVQYFYHRPVQPQIITWFLPREREEG